MKTEKKNIKIGWSETDITPRGKCELAGQYYQRISRGIHSRLGAVVLAMKSGSGEQSVMISVDLAGAELEFLNALRARVARLVPEIVPEKIMLSATHTHSAPGVRLSRKWWNMDKSAVTTDDYREFVLARLSKAVERAWADLRPGRVAAARAYASIGHCRRAVYADGTAEMYGDTSRDDFVGMEGNEDSCAELLFTYDVRRRPVGVIVNVACPSQVMEATYLVSSDFMGELRRLMRAHFGIDFMVLCQISSAGDQSPRDLVRNRNADFWEKCGVAVLGRRLARAIIEAAENISVSDIKAGIEMAHSVRTIALPKRFPTRRECDTVKKELAGLKRIMPTKQAFAAFVAEVKANEKIPDRPGPYDSKLHHFVLIRNAEAVLRRDAERKQGRYCEIELHVLRIGRAVFCTNPFELFLDYGLRIKGRSRAEQTFVVQLSCGSAGYLPTAAAERHGGYGGLIVNGKVGSKGGAKLVEETLGDIGNLF